MTNNVALYVKMLRLASLSCRPRHSLSLSLVLGNPEVSTMSEFLYHSFCAAYKRVTRKLYNNRATFVCHKWVDESSKKGRTFDDSHRQVEGISTKTAYTLKSLSCGGEPRLSPQNYCGRHCNNIKESLYFINATSC